MFYLAKFCRICVQTGVKLVDLETLDTDSITLSEKLEVCTKMVITRESLSREICTQCIKKLRICYEFQRMCKQSSKILEGYLSELISTSNKEKVQDFINSDLRVTVVPLSPTNIIHYKRKRITKEERCSLLKRLLSNTEKTDKFEKYKNTCNNNLKETTASKGGLRDIISFTTNFDFGYPIDKNHNVEATPLEKLTAFSNNFFNNNFNDFKRTILDIIENQSSFYDSEDLDDDDDEMFQPVKEELDQEPIIKIEEVIIEPDIKIKSELVFEDENEDYPANFVEATYSEDVNIKKEPLDSNYSQHVSSSSSIMYKGPGYPYIVPSCSQNSSVNMLGNLVERFSSCKTFSKHSVRCRTRNSPYINPELKKQFQQRCFKCTKCSRYFKSPGYLKAHISKIHH